MSHELNQPNTADEQAIRAIVAAAAAATGKPPLLVVVITEGEGNYKSLFSYVASPLEMARLLNELADVCLANARTQLVIDRARDGSA
jgi:hypothetical protein